MVYRYNLCIRGTKVDQDANCPSKLYLLYAGGGGAETIA